MSDPSELLEVIAPLLPVAAETVMNAESGKTLSREERAPFPPNEAIEILPPINEKQAVLKRKAADKEFWEVM